MTAEVAATRAAQPEIATLVDSFLRLMRGFNKARARLVAAAEHDVEWSAHLLLKGIANSGGPMRAAELAEGMQSDPAPGRRPGRAGGGDAAGPVDREPAGRRTRPRGLPRAARRPGRRTGQPPRPDPPRRRPVGRA